MATQFVANEDGFDVPSADAELPVSLASASAVHPKASVTEPTIIVKDDGAGSDSDDNITALKLSPIQQKRNHTPKSKSYTNNGRRVKSRKQIVKVFGKQVIRLNITLAFIGLILITLFIYERKGIVTPKHKAVFNGIITALSLLLGLNFFEAFKGLAKGLRWRILAQRSHSVRECDLILGIENLTNVITLGWESRKKCTKRWTLFFCFIWLLLNLLAQVAVTLINLTYSLDDGTDWRGTYTASGVVKVPNLECYFYDGTCPKTEPEHEISQGIAHAYGDLALRSCIGTYVEISDILTSTWDYQCYRRNTSGPQEFAYRFSEYNPDDQLKAYPSFTDRIITASAGQCFMYSETRTESGLDTNGNQAAVTTYFSNGSYSDRISIPRARTALGGTTYIYRGVEIPQLTTEHSCGPRCIWMWAYRERERDDTRRPYKRNSTIFKCPITISSVSNTGDNAETLDVPDGTARIAASAIGLQGRPAFGRGPTVWTQFQFYPSGSTWALHDQDPDTAGAKMAEFAIRSLSMMASRNPELEISGSVPHLGARVNTNWRGIGTLLASIAAVHLVLFGLAVWATRTVIIKDDSNLATARLLRPLIDRLGNSGTMLTGKEISQVIQGDNEFRNGLVYGPRQVDGFATYHLDLRNDVELVNGWRGKRHPDGVYL